MPAARRGAKAAPRLMAFGEEAAKPRPGGWRGQANDFDFRHVEQVPGTGHGVQDPQQPGLRNRVHDWPAVNHLAVAVGFHGVSRTQFPR